MSADRTEPSAPLVSEAYIDFIASLYFDPQEMAEARRRYREGGSYAEAIAYLVGCGDDMRHTPAYFTIPGGKVIIPQPGRPPDSLAYVSIPLANLARRAFPDPQPQTENATGAGSANRRQLGFWDEAELAAGGQGTPKAAANRARTARPQKLVYVEQPIARKYGQPVPGWIVKDRGIGYFAEQVRSGDGYFVNLIHLKSKREMASVLTGFLDHERIREWVSVCAKLTDWNQGIMAILKEKPGEQKQLAWSRQLEGIWRDQETKIKRQLAFF